MKQLSNLLTLALGLIFTAALATAQQRPSDGDGTMMGSGADGRSGHAQGMMGQHGAMGMQGQGMMSMDDMMEHMSDLMDVMSDMMGSGMHGSQGMGMHQGSMPGGEGMMQNNQGVMQNNQGEMGSGPMTGMMQNVDAMGNSMTQVMEQMQALMSDQSMMQNPGFAEHMRTMQGQMTTMMRGFDGMVNNLKEMQSQPKAK